MSQSNSRSKHFDDYYKKGNDRKRLTVILLVISILICPVFAFLFKVIHAPESISMMILSGSLIFPVIIVLERSIRSLNGKLPYLYLVYFISATLYAGYALMESQFEIVHFTFFVGMFSILNFGLQRFWPSVIHFITTFVYVFFLYSLVENPGMKQNAGMGLLLGIGMFCCVIFYSRDKMINNVQDYSDYLKLILNHPGNGFALFQMIDDQIVFADFNQEALRIFAIDNQEDLKLKMESNWCAEKRKQMNDLFSSEYIYQINTVKEGFEQIIDIKVIPLKLKTGNYFLATIMDVTQLVKKQNELSKEVLRAELAEESNKRLAIEIEERIKAENKLHEAFLRTKAILESSSNTLLLTLNLEFHFSTFNSHCRDYFELHTGFSFQEGLQFESYLKPVFSQTHLRFFRMLLQSVKMGKSYQLEISFRNRKEQMIWIDAFINPIFDTNGNISEISLVCHDITQKKQDEKEIMQSLKEKEVLLKEVHHRVKNNLQVISSILSLQSSYTTDEKIYDILTESKNRVRSMAIIHENLYRTTNFSSINFSTYVKELAHNLIASYQFNKELVIDLKFDISEVELNLDQAIPCGLIINEIITNSIKYAFNGSKTGRIFLSMKEVDNQIEIEVSDNGVGFPEGLNYLKSDSLGIQLIVTLIEQLDGKINLDNSQGIKYLINFEREKI